MGFKRRVTRPRRMCADWCGRGCTVAEHDRAVARGAKLAEKMGAGWKSVVWENLGWHYAVVSPCGRIKLHENWWAAGDAVASYTAFLGEPDEPGGLWAANGTTARAAIDAVVEAGIDAVETLKQVVDGLVPSDADQYAAAENRAIEHFSNGWRTWPNQWSQVTPEWQAGFDARARLEQAQKEGG